MNWRVEFTPGAVKDIERLSTKDQRRILEFLNQRVSPHPNPRALAKRLAATRAEAWRFRVGATGSSLNSGTAGWLSWSWKLETVAKFIDD